MLIYIQKDALQDPEGTYPFRALTLAALRQITDGGKNLRILSSSLTEDQVRLLEQEGINWSEAESPDLEIRAEGEQLKITDTEQSVLFTGAWDAVAGFINREARKASLTRTTNETDIRIDINLDGTGKADIKTGLNFFDHMLDQIARHGLVDLELKCDGDLEVDEHHTIEDVAIALGEVITKALGNKKGIERYGFVLPMDEAQATVALDLSGRPYLVFEGEFSREYVGDFPTEMIKHFFYSLAMNLKATIHVSFSGENDHHKIEACFKGFARALKMAIEQNGRIKNLVPSSKGTL